MSATIAKNEIYEPKKLDAIYQNLVAIQQGGKDQLYEIRIDEFPVVGKNNDPSRFMDYAEFITPESRYISVLLYKANGQSDKYFFHLQSGSFQKAEQLRGIEIVKPIDEKELTEKIRKDLHYEEVLKENATLKKEIEEYEGIYKQMEEKMEAMKANRDLTWQTAGGLLLKGAMNSDTIKEKIPFLGELAGMNESKTQSAESEATFKRKNVQDVEEEAVEITDKERGYLLFIEDVRNRIGDIELANVMHLLDLMASNPQSVPFAIRHVTNFLKMQEQHQNAGNNEKV